MVNKEVISKRAQGNVVSVVLVILLVIGLIAILGIVISNFVKTGAGEIEAAAACTGLNLEVASASCVNLGTTMDVSVRYTAEGSAGLTKIRTSATGDQTANSVDIDASSLNPGQSIPANIGLSSGTFLTGETMQVSVVGVIQAEGAEEEACPISDEITVVCTAT